MILGDKSYTGKIVLSHSVNTTLCNIIVYLILAFFFLNLLGTYLMFVFIWLCFCANLNFNSFLIKYLYKNLLHYFIKLIILKNFSFMVKLNVLKIYFEIFCTS